MSLRVSGRNGESAVCEPANSGTPPEVALSELRTSEKALSTIDWRPGESPVPSALISCVRRSDSVESIWLRLAS